MYRVRGMYESICRNLPIVLSDKEYAKAKLIFGGEGNGDFSSKLHQCNSKLRYSKMFGIIHFEYKVPSLNIVQIINKVGNPKNIYLDLDEIMHSHALVSIYSDELDIEGTKKCYIDFLDTINNKMEMLIKGGEKLYDSSNISVYHVKVKEGYDGIIGVRGDEILFVYMVELSTYFSNYYRGIYFSDEYDMYILGFKVYSHHEYVLYISKSDYGVVKNEVIDKCTV